MSEGMSVQAWVKKAVADIAAFGGELRQIDENEKNALSTLLAGPGLNPADKDYIEGFMLEKNTKVDKIDDKDPVKNEERVIDVPVGPLGASSMEEMAKVEELYNSCRLFFDENGSVIKNEVRGKNGEVTRLTNINHLSDDELEFWTEQKMPDETIISSRNVLKKGELMGVTTDYIMKRDDKVLYEMHKTENGQTNKFNKSLCRGVSGFPALGLQDLKKEEINELFEKTENVEEVCKNGIIIRRYLDADDNELYSVQGQYTIGENGFIQADNNSFRSTKN